MLTFSTQHLPASQSGLASHLSRLEAAAYGLRLAEAASRFVQGAGPVPPELLPYTNLRRGAPLPENGRARGDPPRPHTSHCLVRRAKPPEESGRVPDPVPPPPPQAQAISKLVSEVKASRSLLAEALAQA